MVGADEEEAEAEGEGDTEAEAKAGAEAVAVCMLSCVWAKEAMHKRMKCQDGGSASACVCV